MLLRLPENFSENGARPVQILGRSRPIDRLGALVFRPLDRHGNAIVGGRTTWRPTLIAGRAVSRAGGHTVGETFPPKRTLPAQRKYSHWLLLPPQNSLPPCTCRRQRIDCPAPDEYKNLAQENGRGRQASAIGCPVSFVRIIREIVTPNPSP